MFGYRIQLIIFKIDRENTESISQPGDLIAISSIDDIVLCEI